jgi:hypothetical protein
MRSGSTAAQALLVARLVLVRAVSAHQVGRWLESTRFHSLKLSKQYGTDIATSKHRA